MKFIVGGDVSKERIGISERLSATVRRHKDDGSTVITLFDGKELTRLTHDQWRQLTLVISDVTNCIMTSESQGQSCYMDLLPEGC
jgi:hypothetical protein